MQVPYARLADELYQLFPNSPVDPYLLQRGLNEIKDISGHFILYIFQVSW